MATVLEPGLTGEAKLASELAGLDALEQTNRPAVSLAVRIWRATWPKVAAIGIALFAWQVVVWSGWRPTYVLPGPMTVLRAVLVRPRRARDVEGDRHDAAPRRGRLRPRRRRRHAHRPGRVAVQVAAHRGRLAHHRPADHAVDRMVPARAVAVPSERGRDHVRRRDRRRALDRQRADQRHRPRAAAVDPGRASARRSRLERLPVRHPPRRAARRSSPGSSKAGRSPGAASWPASCS